RIRPEGAEGPYLLGRVLEHQGQRGAAALQYRRAAERDPRNAAAWARLGRLSLELRDYETAVQSFERLVQLDPESFESWLNLGMALLGKSQIPEAREALDRAQAIRPEDARPSYPLAVILHRYENDPEAALQHYRRYVANAPIHLPPEHPVFAQLRECEQLVQLLAQARAEEEARRRREAMAQEAAARGAESPDTAAPQEGETVPASHQEESDPDLLPPPDFDPDEPAPVEGY
ncbi:MAG: tetratricopeptide repeat protein, partial [Pseudomonadota bacterium]